MLAGVHRGLLTHMSDSNEKGPRIFTTTHWSVVMAARDPAAPAARMALERLCAIYWSPIYFFFRRRGHPPERAEDLTQGLFAKLTTNPRAFAEVDPARGKFRNFLLRAAQNHVGDEIDKQGAEKRGGNVRVIPWDELTAEELYQHEPVDGSTPENIFERRWALTVLAGAQEALRAECSAAGKGELFDVLKEAIFCEREDNSTYAELGARLGKTQDAVRTAVPRLRERFGTLLRAEIAKTLDQPTEAQVEDELRDLIRILQS